MAVLYAVLAQVSDAVPAVQAQAQPEQSAGDVWKLATYALAGVVGLLAAFIAKDIADDKKREDEAKKEARDREAQLNVMLANALKKSKGGDS